MITLKIKYANKSKLLFTGTDSLMHEIKTEDVQKDFSRNKKIFDFSNCSTRSKYHDYLTKMIIRKMKDEIGGVTIVKYVGLKLKMYSFLVDNNEHIC